VTADLVAARRWAAAAVRAGRRYVVPREATEHRAAVRGMTVPDLPSSARRTGSVWAVSMVKDEADIIVSTVEHLLDQDVDQVLVADNGSSDGTLDLLHDLARRAPVHVAVDAEPRYFQAAKMTLLADAARRAGADWVVPFDADELWFAVGSSLAGHLRAVSEGLVLARLFNVFPTRDDGWRLDLTPHSFRKVAIRAHWAARLGVGNHTASHPGEHVPGLYIAHYPWRSAAQLRRKGVQGGAALTDAQIARGVGRHWARFRDAEEAWTDQAWADILDGRSRPDLWWSPVGPFRDEDPRTWKSWPADLAPRTAERRGPQP
jgi:hypothetical protein